MPLKDVQLFFKLVETDKALQAKVKALAQKHKEQVEPGVAELVKLAAAAGFHFTAAELTEARKQTTASEPELGGQASEEKKECAFGYKCGVLIRF